MSFFGNNMNIIFTYLNTFLFKCVRVASEKVPDSVKEFEYQKNIIMLFNKSIVIVSEHQKNIIMLFNKSIAFVIEHQQTMFITFNFIMLTCVFFKFFILYTERCEFLQMKHSFEGYCSLNKIKTTKMEYEFEEKNSLLKSFQSTYTAKQGMHNSIDEMVTHCNKVVENGKKLQKLQEELEEKQSVVFQQKLKDIEAIMINDCYNDSEYLKYDSEEWTMDLLKEKAIQMNIPEIQWGNKTVIGFVIRTVEQLVKIGDIVEPVYPSGYETQEMSDDDEEKPVEFLNGEEGYSDKEEKYSNDPEWIPTQKGNWDLDEEEYEENINDLISVMSSSPLKGKTSYFVETVRSKSLENLIELNGLKWSYSYDLSPGYTLSGCVVPHTSK
jgi:hypothetical protein